VGAQQGAVRRLADEHELVAAVLACLRVGPFARLGQREAAQQGAGRRHREQQVLHPRLAHQAACARLALGAIAGQHAFVVHEVAPPGMAEQCVRAVHVLGVDRRHHEGSGPGLRALVVARRFAFGLRRAAEAGRQRKGVGHRARQPKGHVASARWWQAG
jgi:hypothetical protein